VVRTTQTRTIRIVNDTKNAKGVKELSRQFGTLNKNVKTLKSGFGGLRTSFLGFAGAISVREVGRAIDSFQLLEDRIKVFTGSTEEATKVFDDLAQAASFTKTSVDGLAQSYSRIALATQELGLSQDQILATTIALQQTFRLSGATIAEATASTIQLSQGLSSGQLRGQELRSVLEQNAVFANLLSKELGITRGQLIKFAESGKITNDVVLNTLRKAFPELNAQAAKLGQTFEQTVTIALDNFRLKLRDLNKEFNLTGNFAKVIGFLSDNLDDLLKVVTVFVASRILIKFAIQLGSLAEIFKTLNAVASLSLVARLNVLAAAVVAIGFAGKKLAELSKADTNLKALQKRLVGLNKTLQETKEELATAEKEGGFFANSTIKRKEVQIKNLNRAIEGVRRNIEFINKSKPKGKKDGIDSLKDRLDTLFGSESFKAQPKKATGTFAELNRQMKENTITAEEYALAVDKIKIKTLNEKFKEGKITLDEYNKSLIAIKSSFDDLSLGGQVLAGIQQGTRDVLESTRSLAQEIQRATVSTFKSLEDELFNFVKTGSFEFKKFAQGIIDELTRIAIRMAIIRPLAQGIFGGAGAAGGGQAVTTTSSGSQFATTAANGQAIGGGNIIPYANGGVVSTPQTFGMTGGRTGLMGEAGAEAIMPLTRRNGKLGVEGGGSNVNINIVNNTGGEVSQTESEGPNGERQIDIIIQEAVNRNIAQGSFDRSFQNTFGLTRRGS